MREFGIGEYGKKIVRRHISFSSREELNSFLKKEAPLFISYSLAFYKYPDLTPMEKKEMVGAEMVFEFDEDCPFPTESCLESAKEKTLSLISFLEDTFGLKKMSVNFSGNRGFHIHVFDEEVLDLSESAREEIVNYVSKSNFSPNFLLTPVFTKSKVLIIKDRLYDYYSTKVINILSNSNVQELEKILNAEKKEIRKFLLSLETFKKEVSKGEFKKEHFKIFSDILKYVISREGFDVDIQTSKDVKKLIRLEDSLHGETGLMAKKVSINSLESFSLDDSVVFSSEKTKVYLSRNIKFSFLGVEYDLQEGLNVVPEFVAILLCGKGVAHGAII